MPLGRIAAAVSGLLRRIVAALLLLVLLRRRCGIAAAVVGWVSRHFLGDGEEARTDSKRSLDEAFLLGRLGKAAQASAPLGAKPAVGAESWLELQ